MADEAVTEAPMVVAETETDNSSAAQDMEVETLNGSQKADAGAAANGGGKRGREEDNESLDKEENGEEAKKPKVDDEMSVEEQRLEEKSEPFDGGEHNGKAEEAAAKGPVTIGYKEFETSVQMFDYFFKFLHFWPSNLNVNKYEHAMLLDLLKKGHLEPEKKIGTGIRAFQVRYHLEWKSRCFFLVREDDSIDDLSFRKCVDHILPLPENMKLKPEVNKALGGGGRGGHGGKSGGGGGRGGGRGNWRGRGRGGKPRN